MAKRTASQYDDKFEDQLSTKRPRKFLAVLYEMGAENQAWQKQPKIDRVLINIH